MLFLDTIDCFGLVVRLAFFGIEFEHQAIIFGLDMIFAESPHAILFDLTAFTAIGNGFMALATMRPGFVVVGEVDLRLFWLENVKFLDTFLEMFDVVHNIAEFYGLAVPDGGGFGKGGEIFLLIGFHSC